MTEPRLRVAVIGATGLVGGEIVSLLESRAFPVDELLLYASERSAGDTLEFCGDPLTVKQLPDELPDVDVVFLAAPAEVNAKISSRLTAPGPFVVDVASMPHPLARLVATPLRALGGVGDLGRVVVTLLVSASTFGREHVEALGRETASLLNLQSSPEEGGESGKSLAFSCIPEDGSAAISLSARVAGEIRSLVATDLPLVASVVRTPTFFGHAASIAVELDGEPSMDDVRKALREAPSLVVGDSAAPAIGTRDVVGGEAIYVVGVRRERSNPTWIQLWAIADNVRQGAALGAVSLAEQRIRGRGQAPGETGG